MNITSGSVIGPSIVNELIKRGENVVVVLVGGTDTRLLIENTLNTLKSYEKISNNHNKSIVMKYLENETTSKKNEVDRKAKSIIAALCMLFSGHNKSLDDKDLENWINFDRVTTYQPQLVSLEVVGELNDITTEGNIISVASLSKNNGNTDLDRKVEVQYVGYVPDQIPNDAAERLPIHFVTTDGLFEELGRNLNNELIELNNTAKSRKGRNSLISEADEATDDGLVL